MSTRTGAVLNISNLILNLSFSVCWKVLTAVQQDGGRLESVPSSPVLTLPVQSHPYLVFSVEIVSIRMSDVKICVLSAQKAAQLPPAKYLPLGCCR